MSVVPAEIAGIGSTQQRLRVSPGFDPLKAAVGPDEYFVLSRIDGQQTLRDVLLATGLPIERAVAIIQRLRSIGALLLPGETAAPPPASVARSSGPSPKHPTSPGFPVVKPPLRTPTTSSASSSQVLKRSAAGSGANAAPPDPEPQHDLSLPNPTAAEISALAEQTDLDPGERRRILAMARLVEDHDPWALLGLPVGSDLRLVKRTYFKLSKEIHPDRYYGKRLGTFAERLPQVFEALSRAYAKLIQPDRTRASGAQPAVRTPDQPQTPQEYAAELFERACQLEVGGEHMEAMKLFAAAVRVDGQIRYLRRAASCALNAGQPRSAVEYAKKAHTLAPNDPSSARLLATAFRAAGKLADAEEVLVMAMALKSENDVLTSELRNDLAEVRRLLSST